MKSSEISAEHGVRAVLRVFLIASVVWLVSACAAAAAPSGTPSPINPLPPSSSARPTPASVVLTATLPVAPSALPTGVPTATRLPVPTPKPTVTLVNVDLHVDGIMSVEDLNTLILAIRALPGIDDVQGGVGLVQVSFDPSQVTRKQIVDVITSKGYTVKE